MKSGKTIDISKSSLISLKAELSRKQEEVKLVKGSESYIKLPPRTKERIKSNPGVDERNQRDADLLPEEVDLLRKSREVLEVKSRLYNELHKGSLVSEDDKDHYLVDFKHKEAPSCSGLSGIDPVSDEKEEPQSGDETDLDDSEWVEYKDCLGRTRTCHRSDLAEMKEADMKMAEELYEKREGQEEASSSIAEDRAPELLSSDMEREAMRKKWEQQERELLDKKNIHYEDVLFDEARAHGVGYFKFSRDEEERRREQETLRKVREETEARQREARLLRERREAQRQARLIAARQRQRARMGLPPLSEQEILADLTPKAEEALEENADPVEIPTAGDLELTLKKAAHVRPWDIGKGESSQPAMSQEEWVEKQRSQRPAEFAPRYDEKAPAPLDTSRLPPNLKKRRLEEEIESRLGQIRDQVLGQQQD